VLNSASTLVTLDLFKKLVNPAASEEQQVRVGRWSGTLILVASVWIAIEYTTTATPLFEKVQNVFFYIAPPFAVVFTLGLLWRRANGAGALATIVSGFLFTWLLEKILFPNIPLLSAYNTYNHRALGAWLFCMAVMILVSLLTSPPAPEKTAGIIWNRKYATLPEEQQRRYSGWKDWRLWWLLFVGITLAGYGFFLWFRLQHPWTR
jgi:SSS family solute:Na+ symporter